MLIRFRTKNFRSLKEKQELSFVASSLKDTKGVHIRTSHVLGFDLLRVIAIYGANASGKTNVLRALHFMSGAVEDSHRVWQPKESVPLQPFALDSESQTAPFFFAVDLLLEGVRYDYGFTLDKQRVRKEWLYAFPKGRRQVWFKRDFEAPTAFYFGKSLGGEKSTIQSLTRDNSLFLSAAAQNNHEQLTPIFKWFSENLIHLGPGHCGSLAPATARYCKKLGAEKYLLAMLGGADLGIVDLELTDAEANGNGASGTEASNNPPKSANRSRSDLDRHGVSMRHRAAEDPRGVAFPFNEESNGTKALFGLLGPIIHALATGGMLSIDELDSSLHQISLWSWFVVSTMPIAIPTMRSWFSTRTIPTCLIWRSRVATKSGSPKKIEAGRLTFTHFPISSRVVTKAWAAAICKAGTVQCRTLAVRPSSRPIQMN